jgi:hypothetical protein
MIRLCVVVFCAGIALSGCAVGRGVVDVRVPPSSSPDAGTPVKIVEVVDKRIFQLKPPQPSTPSLKNGEIHDKAITGRAIARKRNTYGMALGDILLPEDRSVESLTEEALTKALNEAGYRVLSKDDAGYADAPALTVEIQQFWAWATPGFWEISLEFQSQVALRGDWPVDEGARTVRGYAKVGSIAATESVWQEVLDKGIQDLVDKVRSILKRTTEKVGNLGLAMRGAFDV